MKKSKPVPIPVRVQYDCSKCPGYCCTYSEIEIGKRDIARLAKHFGVDFATAEKRFTKLHPKSGKPLLRHRADEHFLTACMFLDREKRRCTVYDARPGVCRLYPDGKRCGYYDFLRFEREQQGDPEFIATT
jgi:Fe-S-cluster containining protein